MKHALKTIIVVLISITISFSSLSATVSAASGSDTVYITRTGSKYHNAGCGSLSRSCIAISLKDAISRGYGACKRCHPATSYSSSDNLTSTASSRGSATSSKQNTSSTTTSYQQTAVSIIGGVVLSADQIAQFAYQDYVLGGLQPDTALARVQMKLQDLISLQPATIQTIFQYVQSDLTSMRATAENAIGLTAEQVAQQAYATYIASGMTSDQALAQVQANLPILLEQAGL